MTPATLKAARKALGLSQEGLARALGMTGKHSGLFVRRVEGGRYQREDGAQVPPHWDKALLRLLAEHRMVITKLRLELRATQDEAA